MQITFTHCANLKALDNLHHHWATHQIRFRTFAQKTFFIRALCISADHCPHRTHIKRYSSAHDPPSTATDVQIIGTITMSQTDYHLNPLHVEAVVVSAKHNACYKSYVEWLSLFEGVV